MRSLKISFISGQLFSSGFPSKNLVVGCVALVAVVTFRRKIYQIAVKMFCCKPKLLSDLIKVKKGLKPIFGFDHKSEDIDKLGVTSPPDTWERENPRSLVSDENAIDVIHVWGADLSGNLLTVRLARRHNRIAEIWIYLRLESGEEYQAPIQPDLLINNTDGKSFSAKGLYFEVLEPLRKVRIGFNGQLRKGTKNEWETGENEMVSVQFNFMWHPMYSYTAYPLDFNPVLMAAALPKQNSIEDFLEKWTATEWYEQWGQMVGLLTVDRQQHQLMLTGTKFREHGILNWKNVDRKLVIKGFDSIATAITLYAQTNSDGLLKVFHGQITPPSNLIPYSVSECTIDSAEEIFDFANSENEKVININADADSRKFSIQLDTKGPGFKFFAGENWDIQGHCRLMKMVINGKEGFALVEIYQKHTEGTPVIRQPSVIHLREPENNSTEKFVVNFKDMLCQSSSIVGGKGASLAQMTSLNSEPVEFQVPMGLCLTKYSFDHYLNTHPDVEKVIYNLQDVAWKKKEGNLTEECTRVGDLIISSTLDENLLIELRANFEETFGSDWVSLKFAVRSSAIGEDGEEMSAAGQNETFLGVKGFDKICEAVLKCWASQFAFRSVEYKRQNGQIINGGMSVVIQEMVPADIAGVLFSKDPNTGSLARMTITANYGLGETVVSATADPDTVFLNRTWTDELSVAEKIVGKKEVKMIMSEDEGTLETKTDEEEAAACTISDSLALKLGGIAVGLEKSFGSARDIEWAVQDDKIFLLQARPVTSDSVLTDFEVIHELDTTFRTLHEHYSTGNVAEVMPGAVSPLSLTCNIRAHTTFFQKMFVNRIASFRYDPTVYDGAVLYANHAFFDLVNQKAMNVADKKKTVMAKAMDVGFYGRVVDDTECMEMARERYEKPSGDVKKFMTTLFLPALFKGGKIVASSEAKYRNYPVVTNGTSTPQEAYDKIAGNLMDIGDALMKHLQVTFASVIWNAIILAVLSGLGDFTPDHYSDFALLIGSGIGAVSGDVPLSLQEVAAAIAEEFDAKEFSALTQQEALDRLQSNSSNALSKFQNFLSRHGHRCLKEFDVKSISWGMNPLFVIKMLQDMLKNSVALTTKPILSPQDDVKSMKTHLSPLKRRFLFWVVNRSKNAVCYRERAKSMLINYTNCLRISFRHLAKLMLQNGLLPDEELMFLMTLEEIGELIKTRSSRIIMRARRRMRQYAYMDSLMFPEFIVGIPKPINDENEEQIPEGTTQVIGLPVCHGHIIGVARVIATFDEVDTLQPNDILITHATDIGWSPYFPMLAGVVTEIGGLVSHGAVVAREYGLPCVISAVNATKIFKSGDRILLDATNGIISKLADEEEEN